MKNTKTRPLSSKEKQRRDDFRKRIGVRPGYIVIDSSTPSGGVKYVRAQKRKKLPKGAAKDDLYITRTIDNVQVVTAIDALRKKVDYACRRHCTRTVFGWYCDDISRAALETEINGLREEAAVLNVLAEAVGSTRRIPVHVVFARLVRSYSAASEVARTIREVFTEALVALRTGQVRNTLNTKNQLHAPLLKLPGLESLTDGELVPKAIMCIAAAKTQLLHTIRTKGNLAVVAARLELSPLEEAISFFQEDGIALQDTQQRRIAKKLRALKG
jgi:hypothetical protein